MHSSRMRTGRTLTVFRKLETPPPKIWSRYPPRKFGAGTPPPENLEQAPPPKFGAGTPPPCGQTHACENITLAKTSFRPVVRLQLVPVTLINIWASYAHIDTIIIGGSNGKGVGCPLSVQFHPNPI